MKIVFIGSGNVATHLAIAAKKEGHHILQIYSRSAENARCLAEKVNAKCTNRLSEINCFAEIYIFSIKDDVLGEVLSEMPATEGLWIHTAGSIPMNIFHPYHDRYGVLYPLQTFSKEREIDFEKIPLFIEANDPKVREQLQEFAGGLSPIVHYIESEKRRYLHLAAVFACNFVNHMYAIAAQLLEKNQIPFDMLLPLIDETAAKIHQMHPREAQTGPAIRFDKQVMNSHIDLINDALTKEIYRLISQSIHKYSLRR
jgi:predicted short-subunit dehydrogenase-like oxidoreductase (DUF2520 family)